MRRARGGVALALIMVCSAATAAGGAHACKALLDRPHLDPHTVEQLLATPVFDLQQTAAPAARTSCRSRRRRQPR
jgi:hypothetical protein